MCNTEVGKNRRPENDRQPFLTVMVKVKISDDMQLSFDAPTLEFLKAPHLGFVFIILRVIMPQTGATNLNRLIMHEIF